MDRLAQGGEAMREMLADWTAPDPVTTAEAAALKAMTPADRWARRGVWLASPADAAGHAPVLSSVGVRLP